MMPTGQSYLTSGPKHWQDQYKLTGNTVPHSVCKLLGVLEHIKKAYPTKRNVKGLGQAQAEVVPPRNGWSLSMTEFQRNPTRKQSTVPYVCTEHP